MATGFDLLEARVKTEQQARFFRAMDIMESKAQAAAPVASGFLRENTKQGLVSEGVGTFQGEILVDTDYAASTDTGSRPHVISTRTASVLTDGVNFFGQTVNHPGTPGTRWFSDGVATQAVWTASLQEASR